MQRTQTAVDGTGERQSTPREHARLGTEPIDGLRGFAILLVIGYHTWLFSWLNPAFHVFGVTVPLYRFVRPGYLGVDVFFVISAFVLAFPYVRAHAAGKPLPAWQEFTIRRLIKIVPSYLLCLAVTMLVSLAAGSVPGDQWFRVIWEHLTFMHGINYDLLGHDNSVLWSLSIEVQFYVFFPVLVLLFLRWPWFVTAGMVALAQIYRHVNVDCCLHDEDVMRQLPAFLDLFGIGMISAWLLVHLPLRVPGLVRSRWPFTLLAIAGASALFAMLGAVDDRTYDPDAREWFDVGQRTLFALAIGAIAVGACLGHVPLRRLVGNPVLGALSIVSYNLYLWHTLIQLFMVHHHLPYSAAKEPHDDARWPLPFAAISLGIAGLVATAITYFFERPLLGLVKQQSFAFDYRHFTRLFESLRREPAPSAERVHGGHS